MDVPKFGATTKSPNAITMSLARGLVVIFEGLTIPRLRSGKIAMPSLTSTRFAKASLHQASETGG